MGKRRKVLTRKQMRAHHNNVSVCNIEQTVRNLEQLNFHSVSWLDIHLDYEGIV